MRPMDSDAVRKREKLIYRQRLGDFGWLLLPLAIGVIIADWLEVPTVYIIAGIAAWCVLCIDRGFTKLICEVSELHFRMVNYEHERKRNVL